MKPDINSRQDIEIFIRRFYEKVLRDDLLAPVFQHVDWPHHTPIIIDFWESVLLGGQSYRGNPFQKHIGLPIKPEHFAQWLKHFNSALDENFSGYNVNQAKERAQSISGIFQHKLGLI
jgi:hemoglobin